MGVAADQLGHRRAAGRLVVDEMAQAFVAGAGHAVVAFKKRDAPAVGMVVGVAAALRKPRKLKVTSVGGVAVHAQELAHGRPASCGSPWFLGAAGTGTLEAARPPPWPARTARPASEKGFVESGQPRRATRAADQESPCAASRHSSTMPHRLTPSRRPACAEKVDGAGALRDQVLMQRPQRAQVQRRQDKTQADAAQRGPGHQHPQARGQPAP